MRASTFQMYTRVHFRSLPIPQSAFGAIHPNGTKPSKSLSIHASFSEFPLASKIMVRNISYTTTENGLKKEFSNFGQIAEIKLVMDACMKRSKGYAFIQYTSQDDALSALESVDHKYLDGRMIFVELAKPGHNDFGYPKTSGPPQEQNEVKQDLGLEQSKW
ncbi:hypothetical protein NMG60_11015236 [Bertholletia excelsa]